MARPLRPYVCWAAGGSVAEGSVLAFAYTAQEARKLAYPAIADWTDAGFIDVRALRQTLYVDYLMTLKLRDAPHVNDDPPTCPVCETWGGPPNTDTNGCAHCGGDGKQHSGRA